MSLLHGLLTVVGTLEVGEQLGELVGLHNSVFRAHCELFWNSETFTLQTLLLKQREEITRSAFYLEVPLFLQALTRVALYPKVYYLPLLLTTQVNRKFLYLRFVEHLLVGVAEGVEEVGPYVVG